MSTRNQEINVGFKWLSCKKKATINAGTWKPSNVHRRQKNQKDNSIANEGRRGNDTKPAKSVSVAFRTSSLRKKQVHFETKNRSDNTQRDKDPKIQIPKKTRERTVALSPLPKQLASEGERQKTAKKPLDTFFSIIKEKNETKIKQWRER